MSKVTNGTHKLLELAFQDAGVSVPSYSCSRGEQRMHMCCLLRHSGSDAYGFHPLVQRLTFGVFDQEECRVLLRSFALFVYCELTNWPRAIVLFYATQNITTIWPCKLTHVTRARKLTLQVSCEIFSARVSPRPFA